jgi:hypothetical protein
MKLHIALLRGAALLVPGDHRAEWLAEWRSELWYVKQNASVFCIGAFRDAWWVRRNGAKPRARHPFRLESPGQCILFLAALAALSIFLAFRLPLPRAVLLPSPYPDARNLVMINSHGHSGVRVEEFLSLAQHIPYRFRSIVFYRTAQSRHMSIAVASENLFEVLQIPVAAGPGARVVLTRGAWRKYFHADPQIVGRVTEVAGQTATVAAVISESQWELPGRVDAWLLEDASQIGQLPTATSGYMLGRLGIPAPAARYWSLGQFDCASLAREDLRIAYLVITLLSLLMVSATTTLSLGEYPANRAVSLRRWSFQGLKVALLAPIVCCGSLDLTSVIAAGFQPHGFIVGTILAMRWVLVDQRRRCPMCLRLLSNPTRIGGPSHIFLDWYGTELICAHGHGLLYVPEIPTSCYSTQRWQYLDASWSTLFS